MDFDTLKYLSAGNARQQQAYTVLTENRIFEFLGDFTPLLVGTIPIGVDIATSDLDIICCWNSAQTFADCLTAHFAGFTRFTLWQAQYRGRDTVVANFDVGTFAVEIFGQNRPVKEQEAYKHMAIEHALLMKYGDALRREVIRLKRSGIKTEPAFAQALGLAGDAYEVLLMLDEGDLLN